jgi:hypothetical protein
VPLTPAMKQTQASHHDFAWAETVDQNPAKRRGDAEEQKIHADR